MSFQIKTLASGSKGNCYVVEAGGEILLLEAGIPFKQIQIALEFDFSPCAGCLLTHAHKDHSFAVKELTKRSVDVYSHQDTFTYLGVKSHRARPVEAMKAFRVGQFKVLPFETIHNDVNPLGFLIKTATGQTILFATDTAYLKQKFSGLTHIMIECNYSG